MTISNTKTVVTAQGNGVTTQFAYDFLIPEASDAEVIYTDLLGQQTPLLPSQYTITGLGNVLGGNVTYPLSGLPLVAGTYLTIQRVLPVVQGTSISNQGPVFAAIEDALDYLTMLAQAGVEGSSRAITFPPVDLNPQGVLPVAALRANKTLGFDGSGNVIAGGVASALISSIMYPVVQASSLAIARSALGIPTGQGRTISASTTLLTTDRDTQIRVGTGGGPVTIALLPAATAGNGYEVEIIKDGNDTLLTLDPDGAETFWNQGESFLLVGPFDSVRLRSDGVNWSYIWGNGYVAPASLKEWPGTTTPVGWLLCYGQAISRVTYARLFALLSTTYGVGDGSTTFNLPDYRGPARVGRDNMGGTRANVLQKSTTLTTTNTLNTATVASATGLAVGMYVLSANVPAGTSITAISGTTITMSANATVTGADASAHYSLINNPELVGRTGGSPTHVQLVAEIGTHVHGSHNHLSVQSVGAGGINVLSSVDPADTDPAGLSQAMPILQPTITVDVLIKI